ncbi:MAG: family 43 glycosylhydrolase [Dorea sp.]
MKKPVFNPYLPSYEYIPDGEPHVFGKRLYLFGSHDCFESGEYCPNDYVCWSAPIQDLSDWHFEGTIYKKEQDPRSKGILPLYAPDVVRGPDGRYYLFYSVRNTSVISVAVCDTPAGKYEYYGDIHREDGHVWGESKEDWFEFDPAVLIDDDGRIWLYSGSGQKSNRQFGHPVVGAFVHELCQDMLTTVGEPQIIMPYERFNIFKPAFFEAASIRKINGKYYFIYAATNVTGLNYCISDYPDHGFVWKGCLHNTSDIGINGHHLLNPSYPIGNYHGSIEKIKEKYYVFDHRMTNGDFFTRQGVAEVLPVDKNGQFQQAESTSCGLNGGCLPGHGKYSAHIACCLMGKSFLGLRNPMGGPCITQTGKDREECPDQYVSKITDGTIVGYKYFDFDGTNCEISVRVSGTADGILQIMDEEKGKSIARIPIKLNSDNWKEIRGKMNQVTGKTALFFQYKGKGMLNLKDFTLS